MGNDWGGENGELEFGVLLGPSVRVFICSYWLRRREITVKGQAGFTSKNKNSYLKILKNFFKIKSH